MSPGQINESRSPGGRGQKPDLNGKSSLSGASIGAHAQLAAHGSSLAHKVGVLDALVHDPNSGQSTPAPHGLEVELQQKDELISALIHELEQAVEKLDRFERIGTDRSNMGQSAPSPGSPRDFGVANSPFMENLQRMAEDWDQTQPHTQLERIESQLASMHDLIINLHRHSSDRGYDNPDGTSHRTDQAASTDADDDICNMTLDESSPSWEAIKNQILVESIVPAAPVVTTPDTDEDLELLRLMGETPAPMPVDFQLANPDTLKRAIEERDAYIIQLNRLIRMKHNFTVPKDWSELVAVPAELKHRVESLIQHLDVQVRLGEVEMSLERARLARERAHVQAEREQIEKHMRRLGLNSIADLDNISASTSSSSDRRWMRFIGPNTK